MTTPKRTITPLHVRLWLRVDIPDDPDACWLWTGGVGSHGYGIVGSGGRGERDNRMTAHRLSWEIANGPIPEGQFVLHRCDMRRCVNPAHLFLGDARANFHDCMAKGRHARRERHGMAKLTEDDVAAIRAMAQQGLSQRAIAKAFGIDPSNVSLIVRRIRWP